MARIQHYDIGDLWTPTMTWQIDANNDGVPETPADPSQIIIRLKTPAGVESVVTTASSPSGLTTASTPLGRLNTGVYRLNPGVALNAPGYWFVRAEGTGAAEASEDFQAIVDPSEFTSDAGISDRALVTLAETKDWLQQQNVDTGEDLELVRVINDVSDRIHFEAEREFKPTGTNPQTRTFVVDQYSRCVYVGDLATLSTASNPVTLVGPDWTTTIKTVAAADITSHPMNREPWEPIRKLELSPLAAPVLQPGWRVTVTGNWGFPAVPGNIRQAALDTIASVMDRDVEHWRQDLGVAQTGGEGGNVVLVPQGPPTFLSLPIAAFAAVVRYRDPNVA